MKATTLSPSDPDPDTPGDPLAAARGIGTALLMAAAFYSLLAYVAGLVYLAATFHDPTTQTMLVWVVAVFTRAFLK